MGGDAPNWRAHAREGGTLARGRRTRDQLDAAVRAVDVKLDRAALDRLDEIFPGHKTAPEHYAW